MTRDTPSTESPTELGALLRTQHAELDASFECLADGFRADPRSVGLEEWKRFEASLRAHLDVEEELLLPAFERLHPVETRHIRDEHASIRGELDELGLGVELHLISAELIERFIARLRAHAAREDAMLYAQVDRELDREQRSRATDRVRGAGSTRPRGAVG